MPRANRHILPGQIYHVTHRCHDRSFLFRFARAYNIRRRRNGAFWSDRYHAVMIDKTQVSDAGLEKLKTLTGPELLYLEAADVTDAGVERLKAFPNLHSLILWYTNQEAPPMCKAK